MELEKTSSIFNKSNNDDDEKTNFTGIYYINKRISNKNFIFIFIFIFHL
jgi:hypothetical protein